MLAAQYKKLQDEISVVELKHAACSMKRQGKFDE